MFSPSGYLDPASIRTKEFIGKKWLLNLYNSSYSRFESRFKNVLIIMCYAPTNNEVEHEKGLFYTQLQAVEDKIARGDIIVLMGDMNAKVGADNTNRNRLMGRYGLGVINENGEFNAGFCNVNKLVIGGMMFPLNSRCLGQVRGVLGQIIT